jgi:hypothetical protein
MTTEVIVEKVYDTIIVDNSSDTLVIETPSAATIITIGEQGPPGAAGIEYLSDLLDVDSSNLVNGSVLVYSTEEEKWIATNVLENQIIDSGQY